jgi:pimeloyl-ACP methyl ester carboxylesterase
VTTRLRSRDRHVLEVGGLRVRMHIEGDGPGLLLLNGLTRPLESWRPFTQAISGRTVVSFDAPGVGDSPTPIFPLSIRVLAGLAGSVLDEAGLDTADVLGFSHGGAVAQQLAVDAPDRVRRLVLAATTCGIGSTPGGQDALRTLRPSPSTQPWAQPDAVGTLWRFLAISSWSSIPFLGAIQAPTLVVCGDHDRVAPPANSALLAQRIPDAELVMLLAGHDLQRRGTASVLASTVERFLAADRDLEELPLDIW